MADIFDSLWVEKYRPQCLKDLVLEPSVREYFEKTLAEGTIPHVLFCGPAGTGKTTLAKILVKELDAVYRYINASDERGIDSVREKIVPFAQTKSIDGKLKIIILDEIDGFTPDAQRALRNIIEEYSGNLRFILTANYKNRISTPLKSRTIAFELMPPLKEVTARIVHVIGSESIEVAAEQKPLLSNLIQTNYPDVRKIIGLVQKYTSDGKLNITEDINVELFAKDVLKLLKKEKDISKVREFVIHNETDFNSDYLVLLKGLFEEVYSSDLSYENKASALTIIGEAMYKHQFVMDYEINAFCCLIQLQSLI
jgi:replication factor C small subunit